MNLQPEHLTLVRQIAKRVHARVPPNVELDDLVGCGMLGLVESAARFDPSRGVPFAAFVTKRVRGAMLDHLRRSDWVPREHRDRETARRKVVADMRSHGQEPTTKAVATQLGTSVEAYHASVLATAPWQPLREDMACDSASVESQVISASMVRWVRKQMDEITPREAEALRLRYLDAWTLRRAGAHMGVCESRVWQLVQSGLSKLRSRGDWDA